MFFTWVAMLSLLGLGSSVNFLATSDKISRAVLPLVKRSKSVTSDDLGGIRTGKETTVSGCIKKK